MLRLLQISLMDKLGPCFKKMINFYSVLSFFKWFAYFCCATFLVDVYFLFLFPFDVLKLHASYIGLYWKVSFNKYQLVSFRFEPTNRIRGDVIINQ